MANDPTPDADDMDFYEDDDDEICRRCDGWRSVECYCRGDFCCCANQGERDCPLCHGEGTVSKETNEKYREWEREFAAVVARIWDEKR